MQQGSGAKWAVGQWGSAIHILRPQGCPCRLQPAAQPSNTAANTAGSTPRAAQPTVTPTTAPAPAASSLAAQPATKPTTTTKPSQVYAEQHLWLLQHIDARSSCTLLSIYAPGASSCTAAVSLPRGSPPV
jgi:hypothetical protein